MPVWVGTKKGCIGSIALNLLRSELGLCYIILSSEALCDMVKANGVSVLRNYDTACTVGRCTFLGISPVY